MLMFNRDCSIQYIDSISFIRTANNFESLFGSFLEVYSLIGLLWFLFFSKYFVSSFLLLYTSGIL